MTSPLTSVCDRLCELSRARFIDPYQCVPWPEALDDQAWHFSPDLMSLSGTPAAENLDAAVLRRLSLYEALNFFSLNIHGEKLLLQGIASRLHERRFRATTPYLLHFIDEENKHLYWFGEFCRRYGRVYSSRHLAIAAEPLPVTAEDFLFFSRVMVFEDIVDTYNARMAGDPRLSAIVRQINRLHHADEVRHRAFGRAFLRHLWRDSNAEWSGPVRDAVGQRLKAYFDLVWHDYVNADVYRDAGFPDPHAVARLVRAAETTKARCREVAAPCRRFFTDLGVPMGEEDE
jgi:hypothetical protein